MLPPVDENRALSHLMELLRIEGTSGCETSVSRYVEEAMRAAGCPAKAIRSDGAHQRIGEGFEIGNLLVRLRGRFRAPRRLFCAHLDTVPLCRGVVPVRRGESIVSQGPTALGGDDRSGVAALVTVIEHLFRHRLRHPPLSFLFTVGEEVGLRGARHVRPVDLGRPAVGFNVDSGHPAKIVVGATGADRWTATIEGVAAHAGVHPEDGVSAALIAARAIAEASAAGWFGRVEKGARRGTSNVGVLLGGETTNQVLERLLVRGECRSHDRRFLGRLTKAWRESFERAARRTRNSRREAGRVTFDVRRDYEPFRLRTRSEPVERAMAAARALSLEPYSCVVDGGLDANWLTSKGIPTVTLGAGQHHAHTIREKVEVREYLDGCRLILEIATQP